MSRKASDAAAIAVMAVIATCLVAPQTRAADAADDGWSNLTHITRDRVYTVVARDRTCGRGTVVKVDDHSLSLRTVQSAESVSVPRDKVLRVLAGEHLITRSMVFSARSSWIDVKEANPGNLESLRILTMDGKVHEFSHPVVTDDSITSGTDRIAKPEIRRVWYVRLKPTTATDEYLDQETAVLFAPRLWFGGALLGKIRVPLYDSELPEDDSKVECRTK